MCMNSKPHFGSCWMLGCAAEPAHLFSTKTMFTLDVRRCDPSFPAFLPSFRSLREA
jgi:hypothetical protein